MEWQMVWASSQTKPLKQSKNAKMLYDGYPMG